MVGGTYENKSIRFYAHSQNKTYFPQTKRGCTMIWCGSCNSEKLELISPQRIKCKECSYEFNIMWTAQAEKEFKQNNIPIVKKRKASS